MCGIAGILNLTGETPPTEKLLRLMLGQIRHRGPDQFGVYLDPRVGLGNARLSILDPAGGQQPISNENDRLWIVYNGEMFNYLELRGELEAKGHRFKTNTDTEVWLHLYEEEGPACLPRINGQFAVAIWDRFERTLFLARDRVGVRPLFYTQTRGLLVFASEIKALLAHPEVSTSLDPFVLDQIFTFWSPVTSQSIFNGVLQVPAGSYLLVRDGDLRARTYWEIAFPGQESAPSASSKSPSMEECLEEFESLLVDATRLRLRADVPVGAYLSGGLDSSTIATVIRRFTANRLETFSISFEDPRFDESHHQSRMAGFLGTTHHAMRVSHEEIGRVFPEVIWHTECPLMRTAPAPMFLLSQLVNRRGFKVVLTGEGADEFLGGYDLFKENGVRRFWARHPASHWRSSLFRRLYDDVHGSRATPTAFWTAFFQDGLTETDSPYYSHAIRWRNNRRSCRFFSDDVVGALPARDGSWKPNLPVPAKFHSWGALEKAQYWEISVFLSQYLLSSQGDRVAMAHSVEGRFPFLDHRLVTFANRLPATFKLRGLREKRVLKRLASRWLPEFAWRRSKRPYRAPIQRSFFGPAKLEYVERLLSKPALSQSGLFKSELVQALKTKAESAKPLGESDEMTLVGVLSTQLLWSQFVASPRRHPPLDDREDVKVCRG